MQSFYKELSITYNKTFPYVRLSRKRANDKPWITTALKVSIKEKHKLYQKFIFSQTPISAKLYKTFKNRSKILIRKAEINYYLEAFNDRMHSIKEMWEQLSYLLNTKNSKLKTDSVNKLIIDGKTVGNDKGIANALNSHFLNVGPNLANKVNHSSASHKDYLLNPTTDTVFFTPTDSIEISKEIYSLKNKKSGIDFFTTSLIKFVKDEIMESLVIIFNKSFSEGQFPNMVKIAKVIPVFKGGEASDPNNYRLTSLLSIFDKLLEKVM